MTRAITILAPGNMGAALARRFVSRGLEVRTSTAGRSAATAARAAEAGMTAVGDAALVEVDLLLSVVPPDEALPLAERLAPALARAADKPVYVDCNAVSPETVARIGEVVGATGARFVDGSIIGLPPKPGYDGPALFVSGEAAPAVAALRDHGLDVRVLAGPVGAASALKMCYGGITKGLIALGSAAILAADRHGVAGALRDELALSQAALFAGFSRSIPDMFAKARRWVPEMEQIAAFLGQERAEAAAYAEIARFYERLASADAGREIDALADFFRQPGGDGGSPADRAGG